MSTFEEWKQADQRWASVHRDMRETAFKWFREHKEWPRIADLRRRLFCSNDQSVDPQGIADTKPTIPGQLSVAHQELLTLGARHLLDLPSARPLLELLVAATRRAVEEYGGPSERPSVRFDDPRFAAMHIDTVVLLPRLIQYDHPNVFAGGANGDRWNLAVSDALVADFREVSSPSEYVEHQLSIIEGWAADQDLATGKGLRPSGGPSTAFVVMPFREDWSDGVHAFIGRAVKRLDGKMRTLRADEIALPGRITQQIIAAIREADLIVADITGQNANVFWELGFASALGKPCILLRCRQEEVDPPFDIYDHRWVEYARPTTDADETHLVEMLRNTLPDASD